VLAAGAVQALKSSSDTLGSFLTNATMVTCSAFQSLSAYPARSATVSGMQHRRRPLQPVHPFGPLLLGILALSILWPLHHFFAIAAGLLDSYGA
jgi:hypothetical protein